MMNRFNNITKLGILTCACVISFTAMGQQSEGHSETAAPKWTAPFFCKDFASLMKSSDLGLRAIVSHQCRKSPTPIDKDLMRVRKTWRHIQEGKWNEIDLLDTQTGIDISSLVLAQTEYLSVDKEFRIKTIERSLDEASQKKMIDVAADKPKGILKSLMEASSCAQSEGFHAIVASIVSDSFESNSQAVWSLTESIEADSVKGITCGNSYIGALESYLVDAWGEDGYVADENRLKRKAVVEPILRRLDGSKLKFLATEGLPQERKDAVILELERLRAFLLKANPPHGN